MRQNEKDEPLRGGRVFTCRELCPFFMTFKRSFWWGLGGAIVVSIIGWLILGWSTWLSNASTQFFLWIGLNPREQGLWCVLFFVAFTSVVGFLTGRGLSIGRPRA
jgi:hypothetical protein